MRCAYSIFFCFFIWLKWLFLFVSFFFFWFVWIKLEHKHTGLVNRYYVRFQRFWQTIIEFINNERTNEQVENKKRKNYVNKVKRQSCWKYDSIPSLRNHTPSRHHHHRCRRQSLYSCCCCCRRRRRCRRCCRRRRMGCNVALHSNFRFCVSWVARVTLWSRC